MEKINIFNFNHKHPELKEGEEFLMNIEEGEKWRTPDFMEYVRKGDVAYSTTGELVKDLVPLFGKPKEVIDKNMEKLIEAAKKLVGYGYDDALIQSKMWASRNSITGIRHIVEAIRIARK